MLFNLKFREDAFVNRQGPSIRGKAQRDLRAPGRSDKGETGKTHLEATVLTMACAHMAEGREDQDIS